MIAVVLGRFPDLLAAGLRAVLAEDDRIELLAADVPMDSLQAAVAELEPDLAVFDLAALRTPIEVNQLHEAHPETRLVLLADRATAAECNQLLAFGATAVIPKDTPKRDLLTSLSLAARGMHVMPGSAGGAPEPGPDLLSAREAEVLELIQRGRSNAQIAHELQLGLETVRTHARNIYRKLGVTGGRKELAAAPIVRGR
ncbi:MAG TPA: response regulator transcription factor [Solirubrobacteraceae bacterium]|nr:response regulator transcription factor [Solirubrobacteraceae bacterium]